MIPSKERIWHALVQHTCSYAICNGVYCLEVNGLGINFGFYNNCIFIIHNGIYECVCGFTLCVMQMYTTRGKGGA